MKFTFASALLVAGILADKKTVTKRFRTPIRDVYQFDKTTVEETERTVYDDVVKREYEDFTKTEFTIAPRTVYDTIRE